MSESSKKLLICGGDSWSSINDPCYKEFGVDKIWTDMVADFMDWDIINTGLGGADNGYIHGAVVDAIEENLDRDIVVMANWSQAIRLVPYDLNIAQLTWNVNIPSLEPPFGPMKVTAQKTMRELFSLHVTDSWLTREHFWMKVANFSLRQIYQLDTYCKNKEIPIIHHRALQTLSGIEWILEPRINPYLRRDMLKVVKENQYYKKISKFKNVVGNKNFFARKSSCFELYPDYFLSPSEKHPNKQGMSLIAHSFINKYLEIYGAETTAEPSYVYD